MKHNKEYEKRVMNETGMSLNDINECKNIEICADLMNDAYYEGWKDAYKELVNKVLGD
jgi:hypothetical protein